METWKKIPGYNGYEASDKGRIRSVSRWVQCGHQQRWWRGRVLRPGDWKGRKFVSFSGKETRLIHYLVMLAFVGPRPEGMEVCHNNGKNHDNRLSNLRYDTPKANGADANKHGSVPRGATHPFAKLTRKNVLAIRASSEGPFALAKKYGVHYRHIWRIRTGQAWKWMPGDA